MPATEQMEAEERGRLMAVGILLNNLEKRKEIEDVFGKDYARRRYPEVYKKSEN